MRKEIRRAKRLVTAALLIFPLTLGIAILSLADERMLRMQAERDRRQLIVEILDAALEVDHAKARELLFASITPRFGKLTRPEDACVRSVIWSWIQLAEGNNKSEYKFGYLNPENKVKIARMLEKCRE